MSSSLVQALQDRVWDQGLVALEIFAEQSMVERFVNLDIPKVLLQVERTVRFCHHRSAFPFVFARVGLFLASDRMDVLDG